MVLGAINGLLPFSTDLYLPAFPAISVYLGTSVGLITLSLSAFFAGACIGQLINGPIVDKYGRKKPMIIALLVYVLASIGCALSTTLLVLCIFRFIQAYSISLCSIGSKATVRDVFSIEETASIFSIMVLIMGIAPIIAPSVGSIIVTLFSWQAIFMTLSIIAFSLFILIIVFLPNLKVTDQSYSLKPSAVLFNYKEVVKTPSFLGYAIVTGLTSGVLFSWISSSSLVFIGLLNLSETQFGWIFASVASSMVIGSQVNRILLKVFSSQNIAFASVIIQLGICFMLLYFAFNIFTVIAMLICMCFLMFFVPMITPNTMALTIRPFTKNLGSATALMGATQMAFSAIVTTILGYFQNHTVIPMIISIMTLTIISIIVQYYLKQKFNEKLI